MGGSKEGDKEREDQQRIHLGRKHDHRSRAPKIEKAMMELV